MAIISFLQTYRRHISLSIIGLLLTVSSFTIISVSVQVAYLWLIIVLIMLLFFTTFTCSDSVLWRQNGDTVHNATTEEHSISNQPTCWVIDVPPSYRNVTGLPSGLTPPPCYKKLKFPPPPYQETERKSDCKPDIEISKCLMDTTKNVNLPKVLSNRRARQNSESSILSVNLSILFEDK